jgi:hypothetical protein
MLGGAGGGRRDMHSSIMKWGSLACSGMAMGLALHLLPGADLRPSVVDDPGRCSIQDKHHLDELCFSFRYWLS